MPTPHPDVRLRFVGVDQSVGFRVAMHEALEGRLVGRLDHLGLDLVRRAVLHADDRELAVGGAYLLHAPLLSRVHIRGLTAYVVLIDLDRPAELVLAVVPRLADAVEHVPRGLLRDAQVAVELHGRHALEVRADLVERYSPLAERQVGALHNRIGLDAEIASAVAAEEGHRLPALALVNRVAVAPRATDTVRPPLFDEPRLGGRLIAEVVDRVD